tara:strand:- start:1726 stop:2313 length:588 start_codon:yes stop_codon:yes gene_type:complete
MKHLRQIIRKILLEGMSTADSLPSGTYFSFSDGRSEFELSVYAPTIAYDEEEAIIEDETTATRKIGSLRARPMKTCQGAYELFWIHARSDFSGLGPMMTDLTMEILNGRHNAPLALDRNEVSAEAREMFEYYITNRSNEVRIIPLNPEECPSPAAEYHKSKVNYSRPASDSPFYVAIQKLDGKTFESLSGMLVEE